MTDPIQDYIKAVRDRAERAHDEICGLASGKRKWTMCIPVQATDSDMTLQSSLDDLDKLLRALEVAVNGLNILKLKSCGCSQLASEAKEQIARILRE